MPRFEQIPLALLSEPDNPMRCEMTDAGLDDLVNSIREQGILEPLCVVPSGESYEVAAGHRRLLAARRLSLPDVPCMVFDAEGDDKLSIMIHENIVREDVTAFEEGNFYMQVASLPGITEEELARRIRKPLGYIYSRMDLVKGDPEIALAVHRRQIVLGVARELNKVKHEGYRAMYLERAVQGGCTIDLAKSWVSQWRMNAAGITEAQAQPLEPLPGPEHVAQPMACWLCGGNEDNHNLEPVWIHREELRALRMAREQMIAREAGA